MHSKASHAEDKYFSFHFSGNIGILFFFRQQIAAVCLEIHKCVCIFHSIALISWVPTKIIQSHMYFYIITHGHRRV